MGGFSGFLFEVIFLFYHEIFRYRTIVSCPKKNISFCVSFGWTRKTTGMHFQIFGGFLRPRFFVRLKVRLKRHRIFETSQKVANLERTPSQMKKSHLLGLIWVIYFGGVVNPGSCTYDSWL